MRSKRTAVAATDQAVQAEEQSPELSSGKAFVNARMRAAVGALLGVLLVGGPRWFTSLQAAGWQSVGLVAGVALIVFSLFGDLPPAVSWLQRLGAWLFPGVLLGTILLLLPLLAPTATHDSSVVAFSPSVWAAYISIVLVGVSFERSELPQRMYRICLMLPVGPSVVVPIYIALMGLSGNILDGVSIMAISVVLFLHLLPQKWALRSSFALLFGGLIANLITVAAEPTNIKFQDVIYPLLNGVTPPYWFTNWPISVLGIAAPALLLAGMMRRGKAQWRAQSAPLASEDVSEDVSEDAGRPTTRQTVGFALSVAAITLLAAGIIADSIVSAQRATSGVQANTPLWAFLVPAGVAALGHLLITHAGEALARHLREQAPVWGKLMVIFSLLWLLGVQSGGPNVLAAFFTWPAQLRYGLMVLLSLASSITDNVALAAMQGGLLLAHPIAIWQIRLLFILLTWAGGFTPFGCLQSLATNSRLNLSIGEWFREALPWAAATIVGGMIGLALIAQLYPQAVGLTR